MSIDAVALLRITDWEPDEELDTRPLDDGSTLLYLEVPFESSPVELLEAIAAAVGEELIEHDDERGIFVLPDAADPDDAKGYEDVIAKVGEAGHFLPLVDEAPDLQSLFGGAGQQDAINNAFSSLGLGSLEDLQRMMQSGDTEGLQMMQIKMQNMLEQAQRSSATSSPGETPAPKGDERNEPIQLPEKPKEPKS
jgi:hypothetical protein